jgi:hypothetical protein
VEELDLTYSGLSLLQQSTIEFNCRLDADRSAFALKDRQQCITGWKEKPAMAGAFTAGPADRASAARNQNIETARDGPLVWPGASQRNSQNGRTR